MVINTGLIYGVGLNDLKESVRNSHARKVWGSMLTRCYCPKYKHKYPTYDNVTIVEDWLTYSNFKLWYNSHTFKLDDLYLDKDFLSDQCKTYGPNTCCFLPNYINTLFSRCGYNYRNQCKGLIGVTRNGSESNPYEVYGYDKLKHKRSYLGCYQDELTAHRVWQTSKISQIEKTILDFKKEECYDDRVEKELEKIITKIEADLLGVKPTYYI